MNEPRTVLIIEDNRIFAKVIRKRFECRGYRTEVAHDGLEGYALARETRPDLILLDLMLPGLDGHKVCRLIKFDKALRGTPVAILTSRDSDEDEALSKQARADAYLLKTVRPEVLLDVARDLMEKGGRNAADPVPEAAGLSVETDAA
jgi:two-component system, OmpR family, response regulator